MLRDIHVPLHAEKPSLTAHIPRVSRLLLLAEVHAHVERVVSQVAGVGPGVHRPATHALHGARVLVGEALIEFVVVEDEERRLPLTARRRARALHLVPQTFKLCASQNIDHATRYMYTIGKRYIQYTGIDYIHV